MLRVGKHQYQYRIAVWYQMASKVKLEAENVPYIQQDKVASTHPID